MVDRPNELNYGLGVCLCACSAYLRDGFEILSCSILGIEEIRVGLLLCFSYS